LSHTLSLIIMIRDAFLRDKLEQEKAAEQMDLRPWYQFQKYSQPSNKETLMLTKLFKFSKTKQRHKGEGSLRFLNMAQNYLEGEQKSDMEKNRLALKFVEMSHKPKKYEHLRKFTEEGAIKTQLNLSREDIEKIMQKNRSRRNHNVSGHSHQFSSHMAHSVTPARFHLDDSVDLTSFDPLSTNLDLKPVSFATPKRPSFKRKSVYDEVKNPSLKITSSIEKIQKDAAIVMEHHKDTYSSTRRHNRILVLTDEQKQELNEKRFDSLMGRLMKLSENKHVDKTSVKEASQRIKNLVKYRHYRKANEYQGEVQF